MKTFKQYAKEKGVSYEAIRKQVNETYVEELESLVIKKGRATYLTQEAIDFLDSKRQDNPIIIRQVSKDEEIEELKNNIQMLMIENRNLQAKIIKLHDSKDLLETDNKRLLLIEADSTAKAERLEALEKEQEASLKQLQEKNDDLTALQKSLDEITREFDDYKKRGFWKRLFNR